MHKRPAGAEKAQCHDWKGCTDNISESVLADNILHTALMLPQMLSLTSTSALFQLLQAEKISAETVVLNEDGKPQSLPPQKKH